MIFNEQNIVEYIIEKYAFLLEIYSRQIYYYTDDPEPEDEWQESQPRQTNTASFCSKLMCLQTSIKYALVSADHDCELSHLFSDIEQILSCTDSQDIHGDFEICFFESLINSLSHNNDFQVEKLTQILGSISKDLCIRNEKAWGTNYLGLIKES